MKVPRCKGMWDMLPDDMAKFRRIDEVFRGCSLKWGYEEVRTPTIEHLHLFTATGTLTPSMLGRVYSFLDWDGWSGERVVLRPEGTIPAARLYLENFEGGGITKLFYVQNTFTFDETGRERRERWQCGAELIGSDQPLADVELVLLAVDILDRLGIGPVEIKLSHASLIKAILAELGLEAAEQTEIFDQILEGNLKALAGIETEDEDLKRALALLLDVTGSSPGFVENIRSSLSKVRPGLEPSLNNLSAITQLLNAMGCRYQIDIASGRGFEYYTGAMFQFYVSTEWVGGGGRYDDLIPLVGGPPVPASGFALYVDRLMAFVDVGERSYQGVLVCPRVGDAKGLRACFEVARLLREMGYLAELDLGRKEVSRYRWLLSVAAGGPFQLTDQTTGKRSEAASPSGILKAMEGCR